MIVLFNKESQSGNMLHCNNSNDFFSLDLFCDDSIWINSFLKEECSLQSFLCSAKINQGLKGLLIF